MAGDEEQRTGWIDLAVKLAPYVGMSPVRVRWRLENRRRRRAEAARRHEQRIDHIRYQHKTCAACGAVQDRDAAICSRCGEPLARRSMQVLGRLGVLAPEWVSMSTLLGLTLVLAFARVFLAGPGGAGDLFGLPVRLLVEYGGNLPREVLHGQYWRLLTACFLHAGLWHIGFNLFALSTIGPQVEALYGRLTLLFFFVVTGVLASLGSGLAGLAGVGIGASGGIMGLLGVAAGWGQREGTSTGRQVRNDMLKWAAYVIIFGFFLKADNWAHVFGLVTGFALGWAIRPQAWRRPAMATVRIAAGAIGVAATIAALVLIALPPSVPMSSLGVRPDVLMRGWTEVCRLHAAGDDAAARARAQRLLEMLQPGTAAQLELDDRQLDSACAQLNGGPRQPPP
ncbi:MAG TPA: rhomboid family intramembrane serine protease [Kofleriaceae bacterium]|nr:rhomboid family intramembrane serine protease [Kofleriaceae bacterium]